MRQSGKVFLVGAGPGDPELLTIKALRILERADAVVFDRLVCQEIPDFVPAHALRFDVGKRALCHPVPQVQINAILVALAREGRIVARLKGGDPFIFGRGGEEAIALAEARIPFEIVPGVTAAQACAASAGVPLTHRGVANSVRYLTGHAREDGALDFDWRGLADPQTTLVVYMGLANIPEIAARLLEAGRGPETPVLAISKGATIHERRLMSTLGRIPHDVSKAKFDPPTLFIIGEVAALSEILGQSCDAMRPQTLAAE